MNDVNNKGKTAVLVVLLIVAVALLLLLIFVVNKLWLMYCVSSMNKFQAEQVQGIQLQAGFRSSKFYVVNQDDFPWSNVEIQVNPDKLSRGYSLMIPALKAGQTLSFADGQFVNQYGEYFNLKTMKAVRLLIVCDIPSGKGLFNGHLLK